jgi:hypothetical protein
MWNAAFIGRCERNILQVNNAGHPSFFIEAKYRSVKKKRILAASCLDVRTSHICCLRCTGAEHSGHSGAYKQYNDRDINFEINKIQHIVPYMEGFVSVILKMTRKRIVAMEVKVYGLDDQGFIPKTQNACGTQRNFLSKWHR